MEKSSVVTTKAILEATGLKTPRTLTVWYKAGLIPRPRIVKHPSGKGTIAVWPDGVMDRCVELARLRKPGRPSREAKLNLRIIQLLEQSSIRQGRRTPEEVILANIANDGDMVSREDDLPEFFIAILMPGIFPYFPETITRKTLISSIRSKDVLRQALDLCEVGSYPVLAIGKDGLQVIPAHMVSHRLTDEVRADHALVVVPLFTALKKAFLLARLPFPEVKLVSQSQSSRAGTDGPISVTGNHIVQSNDPKQDDLPHAGSDGKDKAEGT